MLSFPGVFPQLKNIKLWIPEARFYWRHRWEGLFMGLCSLLSWWLGVSGGKTFLDEPFFERVGWNKTPQVWRKVSSLFFHVIYYRIHIWPIYRVFCWFFMWNVGKYIMHGSYMGMMFVSFVLVARRGVSALIQPLLHIMLTCCFFSTTCDGTSWVILWLACSQKSKCTVRWLKVLYHELGLYRRAQKGPHR